MIEEQIVTYPSEVNPNTGKNKRIAVVRLRGNLFQVLASDAVDVELDWVAANHLIRSLRASFRELGHVLEA